MKVIDATPTKRLYRSIIVDYGLETATAELVDNAIDAWLRSPGGPDLVVKIDIDVDQQTMLITDNAGGVPESDLRRLISPGATSSDGANEIIGIFGVGSKRAVVALSQDIKITTRHHKKATYRLRYDDDWLKNSDSWEVDYERVDEDICPSTTVIDLSRLRFRIKEGDIKSLQKFLSYTYAKIELRGRLKILLNDSEIHSTKFDNWSYHPHFGPRVFQRRIRRKKPKEKIRFVLTGGLVRERGGEYGVYFYCNGRLITKALKGAEVGFQATRTGHHVEFSLARIIVEMNGPSGSMPWTSDKSRINYNHEVFKEIRDDIIRASETYKKLSRRLFKTFKEEVLPYEEGTLPKAETLAKEDVLSPSKLPPIPRARNDYKAKLIDLNASVANNSPWTRGLYEAIIAEAMISRQRILKQGKRISLILLDSTLEIAFKDFLAWRIKQPLGDDKLSSLFKNRLQVHEEVKKHLSLDAGAWGQIDYFYKLRCELVHRKVNAEIDQESLDKFREVVKNVLTKAHDIRFPD